MLGRKEAPKPTEPGSISRGGFFSRNVTKINEDGSQNGASAVYLVEANRPASQTVPR